MDVPPADGPTQAEWDAALGAAIDSVGSSLIMASIGQFARAVNEVTKAQQERKEDE